MLINCLLIFLFLDATKNRFSKRRDRQGNTFFVTDEFIKSIIQSEFGSQKKDKRLKGRWNVLPHFVLSLAFSFFNSYFDFNTVTKCSFCLCSLLFIVLIMYGNTE